MSEHTIVPLTPVTSGYYRELNGRGIVKIERTDGDGSAGTVDTYTITYTNSTTSTFQIRNGPTENGMINAYAERLLEVEAQIRSIAASFNIRTWATGQSYGPGTIGSLTDRRDVVLVSGVWYVAAVEHVAGASFAADLAAGKWLTTDPVQLRGDLADSGTGKGMEMIPSGVLPVADYATLKAKAALGFTRFYVTGPLGTAKPSGIAGYWQVDPTDTASAEDGGTILVQGSIRIKRDYIDRVHLAWWNVDTTGVIPCHVQLQKAVDIGLPVILPEGTLLGTVTVTYHKGAEFIGSGMTKTIYNYRGAANTWAFKHAFLNDSGIGTFPTNIYPEVFQSETILDIDFIAPKGLEEYPGRVRFADFTITGDGTEIYGEGATVGGINAGSDNSDKFCALLWYTIERMKVNYCWYGLMIEGFAQKVDNCEFSACVVGIDWTHPEQCSMTDTWCLYNVVGVDINQRKRSNGRRFHITGGSIQWNAIGVRGIYVWDLTIDAYFEHQTIADVMLGRAGDTTYTYASWNFDGRIQSMSPIDGGFHGTTVPGVANIALYGQNGFDILYTGVGGYNTTKPHVYADGYSKKGRVRYNGTSSLAAEPFLFDGSSMTCYAIPWKGQTDHVYPTLATNATSVPAAPVRYYLTDSKQLCIAGAFSVGGTAPSGPLFTLPEKYIPIHSGVFTCGVYDITASAVATTLVEVSTSGAVTWLVPGANRVVYLDGINFSAMRQNG